MTNQSNKICNLAIIIVTFLMLSTTTIFAQKAPQTSDVDPKVDYDQTLVEAMKGKNYEKGLVSYTVMKSIFHKENIQQVNFNVEVDREQKVIIEVFNTDGELIQVLYNDYLEANELAKFTVNGERWEKKLSYYIRVTTEDYIENHEVVFEK